MINQALRLLQALSSRLRIAAGNSFVRDVGKLVTGTVGGQLIALAALPIATRLYSPDDFTTLATYLGVVSIMAVAACLRLDIAIPLAEMEEDAANLLVLSIAWMLVVGLLALFATLLGRPELAPWLWLVPLGVVMAASYSALQFLATRARRFGSIARTRITQTTSGAVTLLGLGWAGLAPLGLLIGNMLNIGAGGGIRLGSEALRRDPPLLAGVSKASLRDVFGGYRRYPNLFGAGSFGELARHPSTGHSDRGPRRGRSRLPDASHADHGGTYDASGVVDCSSPCVQSSGRAAGRTPSLIHVSERSPAGPNWRGATHSRQCRCTDPVSGCVRLGVGAGRSDRYMASAMEGATVYGITDLKGNVCG